MKQGKLARAVQALTARGIKPRLLRTEKRGDANRIAHEQACSGAEVIIAAGGDGTINEVANALVGTPVKLGIVPLGGANVFALEMHIPLDPIAAADVVVQGSAQKIHPGYVELHGEANGKICGSYFLLMAGVGFDGGVLREIKRSHIARWGKLAYLATALRLIAKYTRARIAVTVDGKETVYASSAVVGKARHYGGRFMVTPRASLTDTFLDLCVFKKKGPVNMLRYACSVVAGEHIRNEGIYYTKALALEMNSEEAVYVQVDGDYLGTLPARFAVKNEALAVLVPGR